MLKGYVLDHRKFPVALAHVRTIDAKGRTLDTTRTDRDGYYSIELKYGAAEIEVARNGRIHRVDMPATTFSDFNIELPQQT